MLDEAVMMRFGNAEQREEIRAAAKARAEVVAAAAAEGGEEPAAMSHAAQRQRGAIGSVQGQKDVRNGETTQVMVDRIVSWSRKGEKVVLEREGGMETEEWLSTEVSD